MAFPWHGVALAAGWVHQFEALKRFRETHGHCRPRRGYRAAGVLLAEWCDLQRKHWRAGMLARDRMRKLDALGFEWEPYDDRWEKGFLALKLYRHRYPHRWPRVLDVLADGYKLGNWCYKQRKLQRQGILPKDRKRRLDVIGFEWEPEEAQWQKGFAALKEFRRDNPGQWPPRSYVTSGGFRLGAWYQNKRTAIRRGVLPKEHARQLREIDFE